MNNMQPYQPVSLESLDFSEQTQRALQEISQIADHYAAQNTFSDYTSRKAANTVEAQRTDLAMFSRYLQAVGVTNAPAAEVLQSIPGVWQHITWGIIAGFVKWQLTQGHAITSINRRLSTIKNYAKLATQAKVLDEQQLTLILTVNGYGKTEAKRIDSKREVARVGDKKAAPVRISREAANQLKHQPATPQGRRDALLICLLLDHGLRVGEVAALQVENFDLPSGMFTFDRPKVDGEQTHKLSADTLRALVAWVHSGDCPKTGHLLRESRKGGKLTKPGMSERAIQARVEFLGEQIGLFGLSPHDCRHHWATYWANKVDLLRLQEAGGWASLEMPRRYVERAKIANDGMA